MKHARLAFIVPVLIAIVGFTVTKPGPAQADSSGWHQRHGGGHWQKAKHRRQAKRHRAAHRRQADRRQESTQAPLFDAVTGSRLLGGILGAVVGTQVGKGKGRTVAMIGGGLLGAVLGGEVAKSMDRSDNAEAQSALETTPTGRTVSWTNPDSGSSYNMVPTRTYKSNTGRDCRDYTMWVFIDGFEEEAQGTACRTPDGTWTTAAL